MKWMIRILMLWMCTIIIIIIIIITIIINVIAVSINIITIQSAEEQFHIHHRPESRDVRPNEYWTLSWLRSEVQTTRLELNSDGNCSSMPEIRIAKDERHTPKCDRPKVAKAERHTPKWDRKVQREFEAKNPGPPKKRSKREKVSITISDDEPDEDLNKLEMIGR